MKKVLCYGDSNTFGLNPENGSRYNKSTRWTGVLQNLLGHDYKIVEEGANNRTGFVNNPNGTLFSAQKHFPQIVEKNKPIDILVLAIGTNDLQFAYDINLDTIKNGLENLSQIAEKFCQRVILIPTLDLNENILKGNFRFLFDKTSIEKSKKTKNIYENIAKIHNFKYLDVNNITKPSSLDGLHYDMAAHKLIAEILAEIIRKED